MSGLKAILEQLSNKYIARNVENPHCETANSFRYPVQINSQERLFHYVEKYYAAQMQHFPSKPRFKSGEDALVSMLRSHDEHARFATTELYKVRATYIASLSAKNLFDAYLSFLIGYSRQLHTRKVLRRVKPAMLDEIKQHPFAPEWFDYSKPANAKWIVLAIATQANIFKKFIERL